MTVAVLEPLMCYESLRVSPSMATRIEAHRRRIASAHPGVVVTMNSAVRNLLSVALQDKVRQAWGMTPGVREHLTRYKRIRLSDDLRDQVEAYWTDVRALQDGSDGELTKDAVLRHLIGVGLRQVEQGPM